MLIHGLIFSIAALLAGIYAQPEYETINGTIYCDNNFRFYVNGELVAEDPVPVVPHNAHNVSFRVRRGEDITFAIEGIDNGNESTGMELGNRCIGDGVLRAMFTNGVVTNDQWICRTYQYGPVNWKECYATDNRSSELKLHPACRNSTNPPFVGCVTRVTTIPANWASPSFDDSHWDFAIEWDEASINYGLPPAGCTDPSTYISSDVDTNGVNLTCPNNLNWSAFGAPAKFIWREDLDLDNRVLCRFTLRQSSTSSPAATTIVVGMTALLAVLDLYH